MYDIAYIPGEERPHAIRRLSDGKILAKTSTPEKARKIIRNLERQQEEEA